MNDKKALRIATDGLPASVVGPWTLEKHERLRKYVGISSATRKKYLDQSAATYIDLYCGYGRSIINETGKEIPGSPMVAVTEANMRKSDFTEVHLADESSEAVSAAEQRLSPLSRCVSCEVGRAEQTVSAVVKKLNPYGLHFALLDPFGFDLPFSIIQKLASVDKMDMLIHVSISDFQRNLALYARQKRGPLDAFAPGWRAKVDSANPNIAYVRSQIFEHWKALISGLRMKVFGVESVHGKEGQRLYWLVFVARHPLAGSFWNKICNLSGQGDMFGSGS